MTTRDRLIIVAVFLMAALGGFWFLALAPKHKEAAALQVQTDAATRKLSEAQQLAAQARKAKASYDDDYAAVATLGKAVPKSDALPSLLFQLQSAAHSARVDFRSLNVSGTGAPATATPPAATAVGTDRRVDGRSLEHDRRAGDAARRRPPPRRRPRRSLRAPPSARPASRPCRSRSSSTAPTSTWSASCTTSRASCASTDSASR